MQIVTGTIPESEMKRIDLVILSPGVPIDAPIVEDFKKHDIPIWGEVELAYCCQKGDVLAITGTNGKTTTTSLLGEIMAANFPHVKVVGNIGIPYTNEVLNARGPALYIAEISSFQLETTHTFRPKVAAILNITPDHLNRHHTMENYIALKKRKIREVLKTFQAVEHRIEYVDEKDGVAYLQ